MEGLKTSPTRPGVPAQRSTNTSSARPLPQEGHWYYITRLVAFFCAWKLLLLAVVCGSPGSGYDTSTSILFSHLGGNSGSASTHSPSSLSATVVEHVVLRLTRWDALYFISASQRGLVYEQEWAFSWALSRLTSMLSDGACSSLFPSPISLSYRQQ